MSPKVLYSILCVAGAALPYSQLVPWLGVHGLDATRFAEDMFANGVAAAFGLDVLVSAAALLVFVRVDGRRFCMTWLWLPVLGTLVAGVSCGLPLFLAMREHAREGVRR